MKKCELVGSELMIEAPGGESYRGFKRDEVIPNRGRKLYKRPQV